MSSAAPDSETKKTAPLLAAALEVFLRYGYRKTAMGDVAEAAGISRQGLYFHFPTKEALFRATILQAVATMRQGAEAALADPRAPLPQRLFAVFDHLMGPFVGKFGADSFDLMEMSAELTGDVIERTMAALQARMAEELEAAVSADASTGPRPTAQERVATLFAAAAGLKHQVETRRAFGTGMRTAIAVVLAPLTLRPPTPRG